MTYLLCLLFLWILSKLLSTLVIGELMIAVSFGGSVNLGRKRKMEIWR
jgi:hypothetical protein